MATAEPLFDAYLVVDWSAGSRPKTGADSAWVGQMERRDDGRLVETPPVNPPTRHRAMALVADRLADLADRGLAVLAGFDFAFGYPAGTAARLCPGQPHWLGVWAALAAGIADGDDNANNRFAVAAGLNRALSGAAFPFWGCPKAVAGPFLQPTRPRAYTGEAGANGVALPERRRCDAVRRGPQPVWKLAYPGSVGSQSLLGIARLEGLRAEARLAGRLRIWPFETGLAAPDRSGSGAVVVAEVYPSILHHAADPHLPKDAVQVRALARHFAARDEAGRLAAAFAGPMELDAATRRLIETEEGWILGIDGEPAPVAGGVPA